MRDLLIVDIRNSRIYFERDNKKRASDSRSIKNLARSKYF